MLEWPNKFCSAQEEDIVFCLQSWQIDNAKQLSRLFIESYQQNHRVYHNLEHITTLLDYFVEGQQLFSLDPVLFYLTAWFHDLVYNPLAQDNEIQSANLFQQNLPNIPQAETIKNMIMSTKGHLPRLDSIDCLFFLDCDLAILGSDEQSFRSYSQKIRNEYAVYPDALYCQRRIAFLESFLARDRLFLTEWGSQRERQARHNLHQELIQWQCN